MESTDLTPYLTPYGILWGDLKGETMDLPPYNENRREYYEPQRDPTDKREVAFGCALILGVVAVVGVLAWLWLTTPWD